MVENPQAAALYCTPCPTLPGSYPYNEALFKVLLRKPIHMCAYSLSTML